MKTGDRWFLTVLGAAIITIAALWLFEPGWLARQIQRVPQGIGLPAVVALCIFVIWRTVRIPAIQEAIDRSPARQEETASSAPPEIWVFVFAATIAISIINAVAQPWLKSVHGPLGGALVIVAAIVIAMITQGLPMLLRRLFARPLQNPDE